MIDGLATGLIIAALALAAWPLGLAVLNRRVGTALLVSLTVLELALLVQAVAGVVRLITAGHAVAGVTFVGYLIGSLLVLPIGAVWALAERSRWGPGVLVIACLVIPVLIVRLQQIWSGQGA